MRSGLETYLTHKLYDIRHRLRRRDRAVLLGAVLSFLPIFPACFLGFIISAMNLFLIHRGITRASDQRLVELSLLVSVIFSAIWLTVIIVYGHMALDALIDVLRAPWSIFDVLTTPAAAPAPIAV